MCDWSKILDKLPYSGLNKFHLWYCNIQQAAYLINSEDSFLG
jgi:hypothetical protein